VRAPSGVTGPKKQTDEEDVQFSTKLVKLIELRYKGETVEVIGEVRRLFLLSAEVGNHFQNTKYNILYVLKTHKENYDLFKQL